MPGKRRGVPLLAVSIIVAGLGATAPPSGAAPPGGAAGTAPGTASVRAPGGAAGTAPGAARTAGLGAAGAGVTRTVTLVTGDRVTVTTLPGGRQQVRTEHGPGRSRIPFVSREVKGHLHVVPADAQRLVATGLLDARLFDVTGLLKQGVSGEQRLIVTYKGAAKARSDARAEVVQAGARVRRELPGIGGSALRVPAAYTTKVWRELTGTPGVEKVWLDGLRKPTLDQSAAQIGAPAAWSAGLTGNGVTVAVLDTGVDATHPDLADRVAAAKDFTGEGPGDLVGHGTHVASIIAGTAAASSGAYRGVAPGARLLDGKVCQSGGCWESAILAGMQWAAVEQRARVVNLSLGGTDTAELDPVEEAVNTLTASTGALFVVAAGNDGPSDQTVSSPGSADAALTVGAVDRNDDLADFSSRGPRVFDGGLKPDITGPGVGIVAARSSTGEIGDPVDDRYVRLSGTSMATPHVAGAAALLAQQHPDWDAAALKTALMASTNSAKARNVFEHGAGRVDVAAAIRQQVLPSAASLSLGAVPWPHDDDQPITRRLGFRHTGTAPIELDLDATGLDPTGQPAPANAFTVTPNHVTVPAGGTAEVTVTVNTNHEGPDGNYSGWVTARAAGQVVARTPVGVVKEVESFNLTIDMMDGNGTRPEADMYFLTDLGKGVVRELPFLGKPVRHRLPKGRYELSSVLATWDGDELRSLTLAARPDVVLDRDTAVALDARAGKPVRAVVDSRDAEPVVRRVRIINPHLRLGTGTDIPGFGILATPTPAVTAYPFKFRFETSLAEPDSVARLPRSYNLLLVEPNRIPDPPTFRVRDGDLAAVVSTFHVQGDVPEQPAMTMDWPGEPDDDVWYPIGYLLDVPSKRLDLYSAGDHVRWLPERGVHRLEGGYAEWGPLPALQPGGRYVKHWNRGAIGPRSVAGIFGGVLHPGLWLTSPADRSHSGHGPFDSESGMTVRTTLIRNGEVVGTSDENGGGYFEIPAGPATYAIETEATRNVSWAKHGTSVKARWAFTEPVEEGQLPVLTLRLLAPHADLQNRTPATWPLVLRLAAEKLEQVVRLSGATVEASYDDGKSWRRLKLHNDGGSFIVTGPSAPPGTKYVSLRVAGWDADGARTEHTVIRAYGLK